MGVSLERVQFKFASIIGELCSEPDVLSQFAVWLDLRLAEYKLKGSISLDCSGEEPDPIWLKGLSSRNKKFITAKLNTNSQSDRRHSGASPGLSRSAVSQRAAQGTASKGNSSIIHSQTTVQSAGLVERLSPDIVFVKDEPTDSQADIFPVSLHIHENVDSASPSASGRKRTAAETVSGDQWSEQLTSTPAKLRRAPSATSGSLDSPSNQSLMSVIAGGLQDDEQESDLKEENSNLPAAIGGPSTSGIDMHSDQSTDMSDSGNPQVMNIQSLRDIGWVGQGAGVDTGSSNELEPEVGDTKTACLICGQQFTWQKNLNRHMKIHDPVAVSQQWRCQVCGKTYTREDSCKGHIIKKHPEEAEPKNCIVMFTGSGSQAGRRTMRIIAGIHVQSPNTAETQAEPSIVPKIEPS